MVIDELVLGAFETNCFVVRVAEQATDCVVIDPGLQAQPLVDLLQEKKLNPVAVILTHGHADHIVGIAAVEEAWPGVKLVIHAADAEALTDAEKNISLLAGLRFEHRPADVVIDKEGPIEYAGITFQVLHTPGHTPGGICLYQPEENVVFAGDALFAGSIGRTDFPGGSHGQLIGSIKEKLFTLPDDTTVYPGHGPTTTIGQEKMTNPFLV